MITKQEKQYSRLLNIEISYSPSTHLSSWIQQIILQQIMLKLLFIKYLCLFSREDFSSDLQRTKYKL